jgi:isoquinoline 1-oxidoreductase alpha subunit
MIPLVINGTFTAVDADPDTPLLWVLRDHLQMTGTKYGCGIAQCGACTVHLGKSVQAAWQEVDVPQCGYCQSGQIMSAVALLKETPHPSEAEITAAMDGNLCRCGTYNRIRAAIQLAAGMPLDEVDKGGAA